MHTKLFGKPHEKRPLGKPRLGPEDNLRMTEKKVVCADWIQLAQDRVQTQCFVYMVMNPWVSLKWPS
jgi:hypothetical protein